MRRSIVLLIVLTLPACKLLQAMRILPEEKDASSYASTLPTEEEPYSLPLTSADAAVVSPPAAPCPLTVHPGYCRRRCKSFRERQATHHADRIGQTARYGFGSCGGFDVFAEDDKRFDGGIVEYYDDAGNLVAASDNRRAGCTEYGTIPSCHPSFAWQTPGTTGKVVPPHDDDDDDDDPLKTRR